MLLRLKSKFNLDYKFSYNSKIAKIAILSVTLCWTAAASNQLCIIYFVFSALDNTICSDDFGCIQKQWLHRVYSTRIYTDSVAAKLFRQTVRGETKQMKKKRKNNNTRDEINMHTRKKRV